MTVKILRSLWPLVLPTKRKFGSVLWTPTRDSTISLTGFGTGIQSISSESSRDSSTIVLEATDIRLADSSKISTAVSNGSASAGTINILVDRLTLTESATIESEAQELSTGNAGDIYIRANETVSVLNPIFSSRETRIDSTTRGTGDGGRISVDVVNPGGTGRVTVDGFSAIQSNNDSQSSDSQGGDIRIDADTVRIENGGFVASVATDESMGSAGSITISATTLVSIQGSDPSGFDLQSQVTTATGGSGSGGDLRISADRIVVADGGRVDSQTFSSGKRGDDSDWPRRRHFDRYEGTHRRKWPYIHRQSGSGCGRGIVGIRHR